MKKFKLQEILNLNIKDFNKLNINELQNILQKLQKQANVRYKHIISKGFAQVLYKIPNLAQDFSKLNINQLRNKYTIFRDLLNRRSFSTSGARALYNRLENTFKGTSNFMKVLEIYKKVIEFEPIYSEMYDSKTLQRKIYKMMVEYPNMDDDDFLDSVLKKLSREYIKRGMRDKTPNITDEQIFDELF